MLFSLVAFSAMEARRADRQPCEYVLSTSMGKRRRRKRRWWWVGQYNRIKYECRQ